MAQTLDPARDQRAILARIVRAEEKVQQRLLRAAAILDGAGVPYAVIGGNAVAYWVATEDESRVRATRDVDLLLDRTDLEAAKAAMEAEGFRFRHVGGMDVFLDGPEGKVGDGVHLLFAGEPVKPGDLPSPAVNPVRGDDFAILDLPLLIQMKLVAWRDKDRVHLRDMIGVGLIDETWPSRYPEQLAGRLVELLADPDG